MSVKRICTAVLSLASEMEIMSRNGVTIATASALRMA